MIEQGEPAVSWSLQKHEVHPVISCLESVILELAAGLPLPLSVLDHEPSIDRVRDVRYQLKRQTQTPLPRTGATVEAPTITMGGASVLCAVFAIGAAAHFPNKYPTNLTDGELKTAFRAATRVASDLSAWDPAGEVANKQFKDDVEMPRELFGDANQTDVTVELTAPAGYEIVITNPERILWHRVRTKGIRQEGSDVRVRPLVVGEELGQSLPMVAGAVLPKLIPVWESEGLVKIIGLRGPRYPGHESTVQLTPKGVLYIAPMVPPTK